MTRRLYPARLAGTVTAPPSKSAWHRVLICRFLAGQPLPERLSGDDVKHTLAGLRALQGGGIEAGGGRQVAGSGKNDAVGQLTAASGTADTALQYGIHPQHLRSAEN